jgi:hypothetical protein
VLDHPTTARTAAQVRQAVALLKAAARDGASEDMEPEAALALATLFAQAGRVAASATVRLAHRVGDEGARHHAGRRGVVDLLSGLCGSSLGTAKRAMVTAERVASVPSVHQAFVTGELSVDQAAVIAPAVEAVPEAAPSLLETARESSYRELRAEADRTLRRARSEEDEVARERRLHARRYCRLSVPEGGGVRIDALVPTTDGARLIAALEKETDTRFHEAWAAGACEPRERLMSDALVRLVTGASTPSGAHLVVRVDASALRRGAVEGDEVCEIPGVGPVSVTTARSVLGDGLLTLLVRDGVDVRTVTSTTRTIPRKLAIALAERDPTCVVPGCGATRNLEIDHWRLDFARHGPTQLDNLCRLCCIHHAMKTKQGWRLEGGPGKWRWVAPRAGP